MEVLDYQLLKINEQVIITVRSVILIIVGIIIARLINYLIRRVLKAYFKKREVDVGRSYTVLTLVKYLIYILAFLTIINFIGINLNYLLAGSAALLVGVGLGLQNTFNDIFSGIILLVDGTIEVGDVLLIDGRRSRVKYIGIRTSRLEDYNNHIHIIPNSELVNNKVDNLSDNNIPIRFSIPVSVSYKSDIKKVEQILLEVIRPYNKFKMNYTPSVFLQKYGDSSVDFLLNFFSEDPFFIDKTLSDIRKEIFNSFQKEGIQIPFPQRDIWIKTDENVSNEGQKNELQNPNK